MSHCSTAARSLLSETTGECSCSDAFCRLATILRKRPSKSLMPLMSSDTRMPSLQRASPGSEEFSNPAKSGYNKGTIRRDFWYLVVSKNVRRHRLISISYITTLPCHGRGREFESRRPRHSSKRLRRILSKPLRARTGRVSRPVCVLFLRLCGSSFLPGPG